jgi:ribonuclease HI
VPYPQEALPLTRCIVHFDGGTPNNVRSRGGFGTGYGSYLVEGGRVVKVNFATPMSNNEAEVRTLIAAAEAVKLTVDPSRTRLCVRGDSQIALGWARKAGQQVPYRPKLGWTPGFGAAVADLYQALKPFGAVETEWVPRARIVEIFGH